MRWQLVPSSYVAHHEPVSSNASDSNIGNHIICQIVAPNHDASGLEPTIVDVMIM